MADALGHVRVPRFTYDRINPPRRAERSARWAALPLARLTDDVDQRKLTVYLW